MNLNSSSVLNFPQRQANSDRSLRERLTPQSLELEQSTLGAMLMDRDAVARVVEILTEGDFYRELHKKIFKVIVKLFDKGEPIDFVTVGEELRRAGQLEEVGGTEYLSALIESCPSSANVDAYAKVVQDKSILRQLIKASEQISGMAYSQGEEQVDELVDKSEKLIFDLNNRSRLKDGFSHIKPLLLNAYDQIEKQFQSRGEATGVPTGFYDLDEITAGLQPTDLIILAARPSMGKCLSARSKVINPDTGARVTIEEMVQKRAPRVLNLSKTGDIQTTAISDWIDSGVKPTWRVTTRLGRWVEVTGHHPFLTVEGWQPLHDLKVGDSIALPRRVGAFGHENSLSLEQVRLLAYFVAAGRLTGPAPQFHGTDAVLTTDFTEALERVFPNSAQIGKATAQRLTDWLKEFGLWGTKTDAKFIPDALWTQTKISVAEFVRVVFSCVGRIPTGSKTPRIELTVASKQLADDVQHALLRFGIIAGLKQQSPRRWRVEITDPASVLRYNTEIGWVDEKSGRGEFSEGRSSKREVTSGQPPCETWALVEATAQRRGLSLTQLAALAGESGKVQVQKPIPAHRLQKYAEILQEPKLALIASKDIYWDEIVSIEYLGEEQVYDLTVPDGSNFVAQDIFVHNTALCLNIAQHIAKNENKPVAVFSLEMSKDQLVQRLICSEASIRGQDLRRGRLQDADWHRITDSVNKLYRSPMYIDDQPGQSTFEMRAKARRLAAEHGQLGLIVIDYLQLAHSSGKSENRVQEISEIARAFKSMARELKCPIIALSQLSRAVEQREDKRPMLSDLRESGSIEAEADLVMFIYRASYYKRKALMKDGQIDPSAEPDPDEGIAEVIIGKHRNGPVGTVRLGFQPEYARFTNLARNDYEDSY